MKKKKLLDEAGEKALADEIKQEIDAAVEVYENTQHDPLDMFRNMYAETTPELKEQMEELKAHLEGGAPEAERTAESSGVM